MMLNANLSHLSTQRNAPAKRVHARIPHGPAACSFVPWTQYFHHLSMVPENFVYNVLVKLPYHQAHTVGLVLNAASQHAAWNQYRIRAQAAAAAHCPVVVWLTVFNVPAVLQGPPNRINPGEPPLI